MTRRKNVPKKVAKKQRPQTWDKKLKTLTKQYGRKENTHLHPCVVKGRLRSHVLERER